MGRPLKYKTEKELKEAIDAYFDKCQDELVYNEDGEVVTDKTGSPVIIPHPPTISGLAIALGFEDRQSIYDYKERPAFSCIIKNAIMRIEDYAEQHLYIGKATGAIFWLKNHGWKDKQIVDTNINDYSLFSKRTEEKAKAYEAKHTGKSKKRNGK